VVVGVVKAKVGVEVLAVIVNLLLRGLELVLPTP
jgi:hypothetical protein